MRDKTSVLVCKLTHRTSVPGTKSVVFSSPYCFTVMPLLSSVGLPCNKTDDYQLCTTAKVDQNITPPHYGI